ncbi:hypothetical protein LJC63_06700 [Ruminococcaceae bacterium OttesenSCG-928-L11]|nr:hypothetical protein [Ruminococcaceae bacterium OttesenSCG-928-L11]
MEKTCMLPDGCPCSRSEACENHGICHQCIAKHTAEGGLVACQRANAVRILSSGLTGEALAEALMHGLHEEAATPI